MTHQSAWAIRALEREREKRGNQCQNRGNLCKLEFAHIQPTRLTGRGRGMYHRVLDIRAYSESYRLLYRECHKRFDGISGVHHLD